MTVWRVYFCFSPCHVLKGRFFVPLFTSLLIPSFIPVSACLSCLLYPTTLSVLITIHPGISQAAGHTARLSLTFASSMASWYLRTDAARSGCLIASSTKTRNSLCASFARPPEPSMLLLTFTCDPKTHSTGIFALQSTRTVIYSIQDTVLKIVSNTVKFQGSKINASPRHLWQLCHIHFSRFS